MLVGRHMGAFISEPKACADVLRGSLAATPESWRLVKGPSCNKLIPTFGKRGMNARRSAKSARTGRGPLVGCQYGNRARIVRKRFVRCQM